jgi:hypothetical protein
MVAWGSGAAVSARPVEGGITAASEEGNRQHPCRTQPDSSMFVHLHISSAFSILEEDFESKLHFAERISGAVFTHRLADRTEGGGTAVI